MSKIPINDALRNISTELSRLSGIAEEADETIGDMVARLGPAGQEHLAVLQDVDLLRQSLDCLVVLMRNMADQQDIAVGVARDMAGQGVYLRALREACLSGAMAER